jgi:hypothetical protein
MIKVSILKSSVITHSVQVETLEEAQEWASVNGRRGSFGIAKVSMQNIEISPDVYDENGIEISPAQYEMQEVITEGGYEVEYVVVQTLSPEQVAINNQALSYLASTDWLVIRQMDDGTPCPQDVKDERSTARARIVQL